MRRKKTNDTPPAMSAAHARYLKQRRRAQAFITATRYAVLIFLFALWELAAKLGWIDPFITSSPGRVLRTIGSLYQSGTLLLHIGVTLYETILGFVLGTALGSLIAALLWWSPTANKMLDPYLVVLNALPKIALGPILIVWMGATNASIIAMGVLISLVVTILTVLNGFMETGQEKQLLMRTLGARKAQIFTKVVLPASVPTMMAALKLSVGMTWVGVIVGEYLVSKAGLGYLIVYGGQVFKLDLVMASTFILCALAAGMYFLVALTEKLVIRWK